MSEAIGTREFAEKFGVTPATVSKWCREGKIPNCNQDGKTPDPISGIYVDEQPAKSRT